MNFLKYAPVLLGQQLNNVFTQATGRANPSASESCEKEMVLMSTYEEFSLIVSICLLIVAILNYTHKK